MGTLKDLNGQEAIAKMKELIDDIDICMFCTRIPDIPFNTRPMSTQEVDEEGNIWFLSNATSNKNFEIEQDDAVQLIYAKNSAAHFLTVYGTADVLRDKQKIEAVWSPIAKAWFKEGKDDPAVTVIRVQPKYAYYWTTEHGKIVSMIKILTAMVTDKTMDDGVEGTLELK